MIGKSFCSENRFQRRRLHATPCKSLKRVQIVTFNEIMAKSVEWDQNYTLFAVRVDDVRMRGGCLRTTCGEEDDKLHHKWSVCVQRIHCIVVDDNVWQWRRFFILIFWSIFQTSASERKKILLIIKIVIILKEYFSSSDRMSSIEKNNQMIYIKETFNVQAKMTIFKSSLLNFNKIHLVSFNFVHQKNT